VCALALVVAYSAVGGCKASKNPIFEWAKAPTVSSVGGAGSGQAGASAGNAAASGKTGTEMAGRSGSGMQGESGTGGTVDQNATFEWTQKLPGMCSGANFLGTVSCNLQNGIPGTRIDGTLVLDLVGPSEAQELDVESGKLNLLTDPTNMSSLMMPVTGSASCMNKTFSGDVPETMFTPDQVGLGLQILGLFCGVATTDTTIKGTLIGQLDQGPNGLTLFGDMALTIGMCTCEGPFELRAQR
jgi:hypothetical protein